MRSPHNEDDLFTKAERIIVKLALILLLAIAVLKLIKIEVNGLLPQATQATPVYEVNRKVP